MRSGELTTKVFERLFNEKYEQLYYFAYDFVADAEVAKDIVSEVFTAVWNSRDRIVMENISSYLHISVRNRCLDHLHDNRRQVPLTPEAQELSGGVDSDWDEREARIRQLQEEIRKLPPRTQWMLKEKYYNGKSYAELSELLGITTDGVKKLVTRTYNQLRDTLNAKKTE